MHCVRYWANTLSKRIFGNPDSLRFDFSHFQKVTEEELRKVEQLANKMVREDIKLDETRAMPIEEAKKLGAVALFGEKYGNKVRVVKYGPSMEFCGGTHIKSTGNIGMIKSSARLLSPLGFAELKQ